jgi:5-methylcytosine-specific restriction endonuclease McrA
MSQIRGRVLLLNADFSVLGTISVNRAIRMTMREQHPVQVLEIVPNQPLTSGSGKKHDRPSVVRLMNYVPVKRNREESGKKRMKIYLRDKYRCQYCSIKIGMPYKDPETKKTVPLAVKHLTLDHITPKKQNGSGHPTNLVTACKVCNQKKADRTPEQARMPLRTEIHDITKIGVDNIMLCKYVEHRPEWYEWLKGKEGFVEAYEQYLEMGMAA